MSADSQHVAALQEVLVSIIGDVNTDQVLEGLKQNNPLPKALQNAVEKSPANAVLLEKVRLLHDIYDITRPSLPLLIQILRDHNGPPTIKDLARDSYDTPSIMAAADESILQQYQARLFADEPTSVLLGLIARDTITLPDSDVKALVEECLAEALNDGFRIEKTSVKVLFRQSRALATSSQTNAELRVKAEAFLSDLQRLQAVVRSPRAIEELMQAGFESANSIAQCAADDFIETMKDAGLDVSDARRIYDQATIVELRNEQAWAHGLQQRNAWAQPRVVDLRPSKIPPLGGDPEDQSINLANLFRDMDTVACDECSSVLSPAAYFVDLLRLLQSSPSTSDKNSDETLFALLMKRRPDLKGIQLSCANTNVTIPYLDLVNEVLEAHIAAINGNKDAKPLAHNMSPTDSNAHKLPQPSHVNISVYRDVLQQKVYPMSAFPYNYSVDTIQSLLAVCGTSRAEVLDTFRAPERVLQPYKHLGKKPVDEALKARLSPLAKECISRSVAAETLGLQQGDFAAITGHPFQPFELWQACQTTPVVDMRGEYRKSLGIPTVAELWGYTSTDDMLDDTKGEGLTFIKRRLLPRASISLQDLHELLKTQFIGRRLVISSIGEEEKFSKKLDDMRLRLSLLSDLDTGNLTEKVCLDLQAFIRLWRKTGWSISGLDSVLSTLRRNHEDLDSTRSISPQWSITSEMIQELAAVKQLCEIAPADLLPSDLQPLWGDIDTNGPNSLYHSLFLRRGLVASDSIFKPAEKTELVLSSSSQPISLHRSTILVALSIKEKNLPLILSAANLTIDSPVSLASISQLYRISLICRMFEIEPSQYETLLSLIAGRSLFSSPTSTLDVLTEFQNLFKDGWDVESLARVAGGLLTQKEKENALKATARLTSGTLAIEASYPAVPDESSIATPDTVSKALALLFEPNVSSRLSALIEGTQKITEVLDLPVLEDDTSSDEKTDDDQGSDGETGSGEETYSKPTAAQKHNSRVFEQVRKINARVAKETSSKLSCTPVANPSAPSDVPTQARLTLTGLLSQSQRDALTKELKDIPVFEDAIGRLWDSSRQYLLVLSNRLFKGSTPPEDMEKLFERSSDTIIGDRRLWFLRQSSPVLKAQLMPQVVVESIASDFAVNNALLLSLLTNTVKLGDGQKDAFDALKSASVGDLSVTDFEGLFIPPLTAQYRILVSIDRRPDGSKDTKSDASADKKPNVSGGTAPVVSIAGFDLKFKRVGPKWESEHMIELTGGKAVSFNCKGYPLASLGYLPKDALLPSNFTADMFLTSTLHGLVEDMYRRLGSACKVAEVFDLQSQEVELYSGGKVGSEINFNNIGLDDLLRLSQYRSLRDRTAAKSKAKRPPLFQFMEWLHKTGSDSAQLQDKLAGGTGWSLPDVSLLLYAKFPLSDADQVFCMLKREDELVKLADMMDLIKGLNNERLDKQLLFRIATPQVTAAASSNKDVAFAIAQELEVCVQSPSNGATSPKASLQQAYDDLRDRRRRAMIQYLLNHPDSRALNLRDADHLFEHLLIDVQMGPQLQTSRIKQAISTVQLFVQRCNLGLERTGKDGETRCVGVKPVRWKYMSKYTLWEANRNLFLYPENWIDPTIRDNKTELFKAFESSMMQSNLNISSVSDAISAYVSGLNAIASLDVRAYHQEVIDNAHSKFHFFGRTRQAPFDYYYRRLEAKRDKMSWASWSKIEVDIPSLETDENGKSLEISGCYLVPVVVDGRLFLFLPQFTLQTESNMSSSDNKLTIDPKKETTVSTPQKYWEIKMGWTEYRNGRWTPKRVSQSALRVAGAAAGKSPPPLSSFQFFNDTVSSETRTFKEGKNDVVIIEVSCWGGNDERQWSFPSTITDVGLPQYRYMAGRFKIRGSQVTVVGVPNKKRSEVEKEASDKAAELKRELEQERVEAEKQSGTKLPEMAENNILNEKVMDDLELAEPDSGVPPQTFPTHFAKLSASSANGRVPDPRSNIRMGKEARNVQLTSAGVGDALLQRDFTWTMSYQDLSLKDPSALVVEVRSQLTSTTYFALPFLEDPKKPVQYQPCLFDSASANELMKRSTSGDTVKKIYEYLSKSTNPNQRKDTFGQLGAAYHEHVAPYALYTWELGMHAVSLLVERLLATQQFELALDMARLVFDPTIEGIDISRCWRFFPFQDMAKKGGTESIIDKLDALKKEDRVPTDSKTDFENAISEWKDNPFAPHAIARDRPVVYMKRFVMKYIEVLIASGDQYFRQNSLESIPLAIQRYVEASHLFGAPPVEVPKLGKMSVMTFADLVDYMDAFSNAKVNMELDFPYSSVPCYRGSKAADGAVPTYGQALTGIVRAGYFCAPANPQLVRLRNLIDDRFYKIRNCLDINGQPIAYPLFDPPLDPGLLAEAQAAGLPPSAVLNDLDAPMPNHRFQVLLQKAFEICGELKSLGEQFLAVKEKRDTEGLTMLISRQEVLAATSIIPIKELQKQETEKTIASLEEMRKSHVSRLQYYLALTGESAEKVPDAGSEWTDVVQNIEKPTMDDLRMSRFEKLESEKADSAATLTDAASVLQLYAAGLAALPNIGANISPMGVGSEIELDLSEPIAGMAKVMQVKAQIDTHASQRASRMGQMTRQLQDRRLQVNTAGRDVKHVDKDIAVQRVRLAICEREIESQRQQVERATQVQEWHRTKYTNETLYGWLENSFRRTFYETYLLAMQMARRAERSHQFETSPRTGAPQPSYLVPSGYWDTSRDGLLSATHLYLGLKRLEMASMERRPYDYELVKNVSLRQLDPLALLRLRQTGSAQFSLSEMLFDMDFPGHYFRRIKTVAASVYCIVGRYSSVNCTLSLVDSRVRASSAPSAYAYQGRDDPRFRSDRVPITSVALSSGQNDAGVFELSLGGDRYLPFEGAGAVSTWRMEFPSQIRQFDWATVSDVVFHVRYTAVEGGAALRNAANASVKDALRAIGDAAADEGPTGGAYALLELRNDFANEWRQLRISRSGELKMGGLADRLPFWTLGQSVTVGSVAVLVPKRLEKEVTLSTKNDIPLVGMENVDFGEKMVALVNKNPIQEAADGEWRVKFDPKVCDEEFYRDGNVHVVVKFTTDMKGLK